MSMGAVVKRASKSKSTTTHYMDYKGRSYNVASPEQAVKQGSRILERFKAEEYVAQSICKYTANGKEWYTAFLYKDLSPEHDGSQLSRRPVDSMQLGRITIAIPATIKDNNKASDTYGQMVPAYLDVNEGGNEPAQYPLMDGLDYHHYMEATAAHAKLLKQLEGNIDKKQTELVVMYPNNVNGPPPSWESFWVRTPAEMLVEAQAEERSELARIKEREVEIATKRSSKNNP